MKTLAEIKDEVAVEGGFGCYYDIIEENQWIHKSWIDELMKQYTKQALEEAMSKLKSGRAQSSYAQKIITELINEIK